MLQIATFELYWVFVGVSLLFQIKSGSIKRESHDHMIFSRFFQLEDKPLTDDRSSQPWFRPRQGGNHDSACERFCNYHKSSLKSDKT